MTTTGYSGTPLIKKLGLKEQMKVMLIHAPENYSALLGTSITKQLSSQKELPDFVHLFAKNNQVFETAMIKLSKMYQKNTSLIIWVSWYKKTSGISTDLTEDIIRNYALSHDLVDIKVCAVSNIWSGLKLVVPLAKRSK